VTTDANHAPKLYRAILIDPVAKTVVDIQVAGDHYAIVDALNCSLFELVALTPDATEVMAVDEEGRLTYPHPNGYFRFVHPYTRAPLSDWTCGRGLLMGSNPDTGDAADCGMLLSTIQPAVEFADTPPPYEEVEPRAFVVAAIH